MKNSNIIFVVPLLCMLTGCATDRHFQQGRELLGRGEYDAAVSELELAVGEQPDNRQFQIALREARERKVLDLSKQARQLKIAGKDTEAEALYRHVLSLDTENASALHGLTIIEEQRSIQKWLDEATNDIADGHFEHAEERLHRVQLLDPHQARLRLLYDQLAEIKRPKYPDRAKLGDAFAKSVTVDFREMPLKLIFEAIAQASGITFVFDRETKADQKASIVLGNDTVGKAVELILMTNQLAMLVVDEKTVLIYPDNPTKKKEYDPQVVRSFFLANADSKQLAESLRNIVKDIDLITYDRLNLLLVRGTPSQIRLVERLVSLHDVAEPEVMLEVEILEVKRSKLLRLGVQLPDQLTLTPLATEEGALTLDALRGLSGATIGAAVTPFSLNLRKTDADTKILASPRIRVRNKEKAKVLIGDRVPNITSTSTATGFVSESVQYVDVGLKLDVEPDVHLDDQVAIKVALEVSTIVNQLTTKSGSIAYQIGTRSAQTTLRLKDGENQILAGLISATDQASANKIPGLSDIPLLGHLFTSHKNDDERTEIVLSITPRLITNVRRPSAEALEYASSTLWDLDQLTSTRSPKSLLLGPAKSIGVQPSTAITVVTDKVSNLPASKDNPKLEWLISSSEENDVLVAGIALSQAIRGSELQLSLAWDTSQIEILSITGGRDTQTGERIAVNSTLNPERGELVASLRPNSHFQFGNGFAIAALKVRSTATNGAKITVHSAKLITESGTTIELGVPNELIVGGQF